MNKEQTNSMWKLVWITLFLLLPLLACVRIDLSEPTPIVKPVATPHPQSVAIVLSTPTPELEFVVKAVPVMFAVSDKLSCNQPALAADQHISASGSFTETEASAAGRMRCRIGRDSCGYNRLVSVVSRSIVFKQEEKSPYDTEDKIMHPSMVAPLTRLSDLVEAEWGGAYKLRVTDAYDSLLEHDPPRSDPARRYSLHYEGRAIDLTLLPIDRRKYGRLCVLAHCAGFEWVHNEITHCHAAVAGEDFCTDCNQ